MQRAHRTGTRALSALLVALGMAMVASALAAGGGPLSVGVVLGVLFVAAGVARLRVGREPRDSGA